MVENLQDELYQLENKEAKAFLTIIPQNFLQSTWEAICKIKQYLNYINWWYKSKYSNSRKDILKPANKKKNKKDFWSELAPVLLDVHESLGKLGTMGLTSRTGIISAIYKKGDKRYFACISEHKQNAHNDVNRAQSLKRLFETLFLAIKKCTWLHHRCYVVEHKMCCVTREPTQNSSRRVLSLKDSSVLLPTEWWTLQKWSPSDH